MVKSWAFGFDQFERKIIRRRGLIPFSVNFVVLLIDQLCILIALFSSLFHWNDKNWTSGLPSM